MELTTSFEGIDQKILTDPEFTKLPSLNISNSEDSLKFYMKVEMINPGCALLTLKISGTTDLSNIEKLSDCAWEKVAILQRNNIALILYIDNSENNSSSLLSEKTIQTIHNGTENSMTYAIFILLSKNTESNRGVSIVQSVSQNNKFSKKLIIYGFNEKEKLTAHLRKLKKALAKDEKLSSKLKTVINPAYFIFAKICKVKVLQ